MAVIYKFRCPDCSTVFRIADKPDWDFCPKCKVSLKTHDDEVCMPAFISAGTKSVDKVYTDMEKGSEVRAQIGAEMLPGVSASDLSDLKITNLRDTHYGEVAHVPVKNDVSKLMDATPDATGFQALGAQLSAGTQVGPLANAGAKFQTQIRKMHATQLAGTFNGGNGWAAMSDNPSNEVMNPNYRRRA
jgi:hypothetical protein